MLRSLFFSALSMLALASLPASADTNSAAAPSCPDAIRDMNLAWTETPETLDGQSLPAGTQILTCTYMPDYGEPEMVVEFVPVGKTQYASPVALLEGLIASDSRYGMGQMQKTVSERCVKSLYAITHSHDFTEEELGSVLDQETDETVFCKDQLVGDGGAHFITMGAMDGSGDWMIRVRAIGVFANSADVNALLENMVRVISAQHDHPEWFRKWLGFE